MKQKLLSEGKKSEEKGIQLFHTTEVAPGGPCCRRSARADHAPYAGAG